MTRTSVSVIVSKRKAASRSGRRAVGRVRISSKLSRRPRHDGVLDLAGAVGGLAVGGEPGRELLREQAGHARPLVTRAARGRGGAQAVAWGGRSAGVRSSQPMMTRAGAAQAGPCAAARAGSRRRSSGACRAASPRPARGARPRWRAPGRSPCADEASRDVARLRRRERGGGDHQPLARPTPGTSRARAGTRAPGAPARPPGPSGSRRPSSRRSGRVSVMPSAGWGRATSDPGQPRIQRDGQEVRGERGQPRLEVRGRLVPGQRHRHLRHDRVPCRAPRPCA